MSPGLVSQCLDSCLVSEGLMPSDCTPKTDLMLHSLSPLGGKYCLTLGCGRHSRHLMLSWLTLVHSLSLVCIPHMPRHDVYNITILGNKNPKFACPVDVALATSTLPWMHICTPGVMPKV